MPDRSPDRHGPDFPIGDSEKRAEATRKASDPAVLEAQRVQGKLASAIETFLRYAEVQGDRDIVIRYVMGIEELSHGVRLAALNAAGVTEEEIMEEMDL